MLADSFLRPFFEMNDMMTTQNTFRVSIRENQADYTLEAEMPGVSADQIDPSQMLMLEDGHCLKDHVLAACNRPELRAGARMMGTSLHTLVQMVDNGLGITMLPQMAIEAGILDHTDIDTRPLDSEHDWRTIALVWRKGSPRAEEFRMLADIFRKHQAD